VIPAGNGTLLSQGSSLKHDYLVLSLRRLDRVVDYQPDNMILTLEAGVTLARVQEITSEKRQWLPLDPPRIKSTTMGGLIAANLSGPIRLSQGTPRDLLLGIKVVTADGALIKGGGRVVKNVAGYDLPKLFCGSFGTLGVIVEASLKVRPKPEEKRLVCVSCASAAKALALAYRVMNSELRPLLLEVANSAPLAKPAEANSNDSNFPYHLITGFAGVHEEVDYQITRLRAEIVGRADPLTEYNQEEQADIQAWLQDFPVTGESLLRVKASVLPSHLNTLIEELETEATDNHFEMRWLARAGNGIVYSKLKAPTLVSMTAKLPLWVEKLRASSEKLGGNLVIEEIDPSLKASTDVWGNPGRSLRLMKSIKAKLDPLGVFAGGRFVGGI
jgi:glycolate oxidase FAD binding subunit